MSIMLPETLPILIDKKKPNNVLASLPDALAPCILRDR
jgi:hypothetical protein